MDDDPQHLLQLLKTHGAELHALFTRLTLRADVAEDLLQELFLKLRDVEGFSNATNRVAYAFRTAIHLALDWRRSRRPLQHLGDEPAAASLSPADALIRAEELEEVLEAVDELSPIDREIVVLHYLQHESYAEIAERLGKTEHQVRGLCHKALGRLRARLIAPSSDPQRGEAP